MANNNDEGCISATGNNPEGLSIVSATDLDLEMTQNSSDGVTAGGMTMAAPIESMTTTTATLTLTETRTQQEGQVLRLTLRPPPRVTWDENVENNEGLGRKSSKRCCIFHKQRPFGESSTDSSDEDSVGSGSSSSSGGPSKNNRRKIARPKRKKVPDFQRYHA